MKTIINNDNCDEKWKTNKQQHMNNMHLIVWNWDPVGRPSEWFKLNEEQVFRLHLINFIKRASMTDRVFFSLGNFGGGFYTILVSFYCTYDFIGQ